MLVGTLGYSNNTNAQYSTYYSGLTCPYNANSLSSCNSNVTRVSSCSGYGGFLVIRCTTGMKNHSMDNY